MCESLCFYNCPAVQVRPCVLNLHIWRFWYQQGGKIRSFARMCTLFSSFYLAHFYYQYIYVFVCLYESANWLVLLQKLKFFFPSLLTAFLLSQKLYSKGVNLQFRDEAESKAFHCVFEKRKKDLAEQGAVFLIMEIFPS